MDYDTQSNRALVIGWFPKLENDKFFEVHSPRTEEYNCIAWAMGFEDRWIDYIDDSMDKRKWWPEGVKKGFLPEDLIRAFQKVGFSECGLDDSEESGYDKVALYKKEPFFDEITKKRYPSGWTHAARVLSPQQYHSKLGPQFDIFHGPGDVLEEHYGKVFRIMKRKVEDRSITEELIKERGKIYIPKDINNIIKQYFAGITIK